MSALLAVSSFNELAAQWLPMLLDVSVKGLAILAVAGVVALAMRRASAAARHLVWFLAMVSLLVLPVLSLALPGWSVLPNWAEVKTEALSETVETESAEAEPAPEEGSDRATAHPLTAAPVEIEPATFDPAPVESTEELPLPAVTPAAAVTEENETVAAEESRGRFSAVSILPWLVGIWALGAMVCLAPLLIGCISLWRLRRAAHPITDRTWAAMLKQASSEVGLTRPVVLLGSDRRAMPMIWGIFKPRLLLPAEADRWPAERRRVVLLHELAHARRWDCLTKMVAHAACSLYWFNPLVWVAFKRLQSESERACDDLVLNAGSRPSDYAEHILHIASGLQTNTFAAHSSIAMARKSKLEGRLLAILDGKRNRRTLTRIGAVIAVLLIAGLVVPLSIMKASGDNEAPVPSTSKEEPATHPTYLSGWELSEACKSARERTGKMIALSRAGKISEAVAIFRELEPAKTPQFGWYVFEICKDYHSRVQQAAPDQPNKQIARTGVSDAEKAFRRQKRLYADFLEFAVLPQMAKAITAPQAKDYRPIEQVQIVTVMDSIVRQRLRVFTHGRDKDLENRVSSRILPKALSVWRRSLVLISSGVNEDSESYLPEIRRRAQKLGLKPDGLDRYWKQVVTPPAMHPAGSSRTTAQQLQRLWEALGAKEYEKGHEAARSLAAGGDKSVAFIRGRVKPAVVDAETVRKLIADLGDSKYAVRTNASEQLSLIGQPAGPALRKALKETTSAEVRSRAKAILDSLADASSLTPGQRRMVRAIRVLKTIDTEQARKVLKDLAGGSSRAWLTSQAKAALDRLAEAERMLDKPEPAILEMRVMPAAESAATWLRPETVPQALASLAKNGPSVEVGSSKMFRWFQCDLPLPVDVIVGAHQGKTYVLLWERAAHLPGNHLSKSDPWEMARVSAVRDSDGLPTVQFELGRHAAGHVKRTGIGSASGNRVAMMVGGRIVSIAPRQSDRLSPRGTLNGLMSVREAQAIVKRLRAGMTPLCELAEAIEAGKDDVVRRLLDEHPGIERAKSDVRGLYGRTPLHVAVGWKRWKVAELLLGRGADINAVDNRLGRTALNSAADGGNVEAIRFLIKHGADLKATDKYGMTPLHNAVSENPHDGAAAALLEAGADINTTGKIGITPLFVAIMMTEYANRDKDIQKGKACIDLLVSKGAKLDIFSASGLGKLREVQAILKKDPRAVAAKVKAWGGMTPLHAAAFAGHKQVVELLLEAGAETDLTVPELGTPLVCAAWKGHADVVRLLLKHKASLSAKARKDKTALHVAARQGQKKVVEILLAAGADVNARDPSEATPLHAAAKGGWKEVVEILLDKGADVNARTKYKNTVLHEAAKGAVFAGVRDAKEGQDFAGVAKLLIAKGADVKARGNSNMTVLHRAVSLQASRAIKSSQRAEFVRLLIKNGADVNAIMGDRKSNDTRRPLYLAAESGDAEVVRILLAAGADPFADTPFRRMPIDAARQSGGAEEIIEILRKHMAPTIKAAEDGVYEALSAFLEAASQNNPKDWKRLTVQPPGHGNKYWQSVTDKLRADYADAPDRLGNIIGVKTRAGWATAMIERPAGDKNKYMRFTLIRLPDGNWALLRSATTSREPKDTLGAWIRHDRSIYQGVWNALYDAAGKTERQPVGGSRSGGLPRTGQVLVTVRDGHLRMESPEKRIWLTWALEVHKDLIKVWSSGSLSLCRSGSFKKGDVTLQVEKGKATWRDAGVEIVMSARNGKVRIETRKDKNAPPKTIEAEKVTVDWQGGKLRQTPTGAKEPATKPAAEVVETGKIVWGKPIALKAELWYAANGPTQRAKVFEATTLQLERRWTWPNVRLRYKYKAFPKASYRGKLELLDENGKSLGELPVTWFSGHLSEDVSGWAESGQAAAPKWNVAAAVTYRLTISRQPIPDAQPVGKIEETAWSATVNGLQCRLLVDRTGGFNEPVYLELRNISDKPLQIPLYHGTAPVVSLKFEGYPELLSLPTFHDLSVSPGYLQAGQTQRFQLNGRNASYFFPYGRKAQRGYEKFDPANKTYKMHAVLEVDEKHPYDVGSDLRLPTHAWIGHLATNSVTLRLATRPAGRHWPATKPGADVKKAEPAKAGIPPLLLKKLDLSGLASTSKWADLPDLFEEHPSGSKSWELRRGIQVPYSGLDGTVYYVPGKKTYYVQRDPIGSSTLHYYGPITGELAARLARLLLTPPATQPGADVVVNLMIREAALSLRLAEARRKFGPNHRSVRKLEAKLKDIRKLIGQNLPTTQPAAEAVFGPATELIISGMRQRRGGTRHGIDFDTGKFIEIPIWVVQSPRKKREDWLQGQGIDAVDYRGWLVRVDPLAVERVTTGKWNTIGRRELQETLAGTRPDLRSDIFPRRLRNNVRPPKDAIPTFLFKTREGGIGVVQIFDVTDKIKGVNIRYKMLKQPKADKAVLGATTTTAEAIDPSSMKILKRLEAAGDKYPNITAELDRKVDMPQTGDSEHRTGKVFYQGRTEKTPPKFRIHFDTLRQGAGPKTKNVVDYVFDGAWLTERKQRIKQMTKYRMAPPGKKINLLQLGKSPFPIPFGQKVEDVTKYFRPSTRPQGKSDPKNTDYLKLVTRRRYKRDLSVVWLEIWVDRATGLPVKIVTEDRSENCTTVVFKKTATPKRFPKKTFNLPRPPSDWECREVPYRGPSGP